MGDVIEVKFPQKFDYSKVEAEIAEIRYQAGLELLKLAAIMADNGDMTQIPLPPGVVITPEMYEEYLGYGSDLTFEELYERTAGFQETRRPLTAYEMELFLKGLQEY
jgi:hypothetical protein